MNRNKMIFCGFFLLITAGAFVASRSAHDVHGLLGCMVIAAAISSFILAVLTTIERVFRTAAGVAPIRSSVLGWWLMSAATLCAVFSLASGRPVEQSALELSAFSAVLFGIWLFVQFKNRGK